MKKHAQQVFQGRGGLPTVDPVFICLAELAGYAHPLDRPWLLYLAIS